MSEPGVSGRRIALYSAVAGASALGFSGLLCFTVGGTLWTIAFLLSQVVVISLIIWQACDPFAEAAQWIGVRFRLPGSVRGATLDAIASSMPELFSGIFFVITAVIAADETRRMQAGSDGYGAVVATCAGSAVYNMILIPAACALVISFVRRTRPAIDIATPVIMRDGMWFLGCELLLIAFLFQDQLNWAMGAMFLVLYVAYIRSLYCDARRFQQAMHAAGHLQPAGNAREITSRRVSEALEAAGIRANRSLVSEVHHRLMGQSANASVASSKEEPPGAASVLFGFFKVPLSTVNAWTLICISTIVAAASCYWLVEVTRSMAAELGVPIFFVAVILAAAASSVPDTFLSIGAAMRGDDDGAVSNVFGSNIFDICVCLSLPLLVGTYLNGWQPISLTEDGKPLPGLVGIRIMLCTLTVVTLLIMWHKHQLTRRKALVLCSLYGVFVAYAVAGSLGITFDILFS